MVGEGKKFNAHTLTQRDKELFKERMGKTKDTHRYIEPKKFSHVLKNLYTHFIHFSKNALHEEVNQFKNQDLFYFIVLIYLIYNSRLVTQFKVEITFEL